MNTPGIVHIDNGTAQAWYVRTRGTDAHAQSDAVNILVGAVYGAGAKKINIPGGAPVVIAPGRSPQHCSLSHCAAVAALAAGRNDVPVGVDVEMKYRRQQLLRIAARVFSDAEIRMFGDDLVRAWTMKEAIYKAALTPGLSLRHDITIADSRHATAGGRSFLLDSRDIGDAFLTLAYT